ncbi:HAD family hydrolase [Parashewanella tropica]|uniref:HAD family hydrolase n=1 Tax=Parashewanella tropica TaxID=2547970 RepID=UPI00105976C1|nr:HAD-IA family hydrolase [Parashewanella tropica]
MSEKIKGILFDLDGTLLDTAKDLTYALNLSLTDHGFAQVSESQVKQTISRGSLVICQDAIPNQTLDVQREVQQAMLSHYQRVNGEKTDTFDGIIELLKKLDLHGYTYGIVTNKAAKFARPLVKQCQSLSNVKTLVSGDSTIHSKPNPQPMLLAAQQLSLPANEIIYVGDSQTDISAAHNAGMKSAIAAWGYLHSDDCLENWNADRTLNDPNELLQLFNL